MDSVQALEARLQEYVEFHETRDRLRNLLFGDFALELEIQRVRDLRNELEREIV